MSTYYSPIASGYPFYGGLTTQNYGAGLHVDWDPILEKGEPFVAAYLNNLEVRLDRVEHLLNHIEYLLVYPSGNINSSLDMNSDITDGVYYQDNNISVLASGLNSLIVLLTGTIAPGLVAGYPFSVIG